MVFSLLPLKISNPGRFVNFPLDVPAGFPVCSTHDFDARISDELVVVLEIARTMHA